MTRHIQKITVIDPNEAYKAQILDTAETIKTAQTDEKTKGLALNVLGTIGVFAAGSLAIAASVLSGLTPVGIAAVVFGSLILAYGIARSINTGFTYTNGQKINDLKDTGLDVELEDSKKELTDILTLKETSNTNSSNNSNGYGSANQFGSTDF